MDGTTKKIRTEISGDTATDVQFLSNRTCCVCRDGQKPIQIHHIDENRSNNVLDNLAVLCLDCHHKTQIRGGFDRKLDAAQIVRFRDDWLQRVASKRDNEQGRIQPPKPIIRGREVLRLIKLEEISDEQSYSLDAEYPLLSEHGSAFRPEINLCISGFVVGLIQRFRVIAFEHSREKEEMKKAVSATAFDTLSLAYKIWTFTDTLLSIEFVAWGYYAGTFHPNRSTHTLNVRLNPPMRLELWDIFDRSVDYLQALSQYCIDDLHRQQPERFSNPQARAEWLSTNRDEWITAGAGAAAANYRSIVFEKEGMRVFFDEYQVGSYAEGRYEVLIPTPELPALSESMKRLLKT